VIDDPYRDADLVELYDLDNPGGDDHAYYRALADQIDAATRDGLVLAPETVAAIGQAEARRGRWTSIALWVIAALLAVVIWKVV